MKWILVIALSSGYGGPAIQTIPMQTEALCKKAIVVIEDRLGRAANAVCIQTAEHD